MRKCATAQALNAAINITFLLPLVIDTWNCLQPSKSIHKINLIKSVKNNKDDCFFPF